jgi:hypothetical protein
MAYHARESQHSTSAHPHPICAGLASEINAIRATIDLRYTKIDEIYEGFSEFGFGKIGSEGAKMFVTFGSNTSIV